MTQHLDENYPAYAALVIPTESARRALERVGWVAAGSLAPLVYVVDAARYLQPFTRSAALARAVARVIRACLRPLIRRHAPHEGTLKVSDLPDASIEALNSTHMERQCVTRDLASASLSWRYTRHPHTQFRFATLKRAGHARAFLVFEESTHPGTCVMYDLVAASTTDLRSLLALFMLRASSSARVTSLRVLLDEAHPWREELRRLGFIARPAEAVFQVHAREADVAGWGWRVSQGDKDT